MNGATAEYYVGGGFPTAQLRWIENGQALVITSDALCEDTEPTSLDVMLRFARNLDVPRV